MFKKLKDKLAEEVKSSPQRIQQFAQAAQAAVTSASSSISDITNSDLFSIGDNDNPQGNPPRPQSSSSKQQNMFQDVNFVQSPSNSMDYTHDNVDSQRQRRLSNSSFASDVSFRLPSYETPSMYHLQSDMEVSASEADDRGFSGGPATLDRVTKEQLYAAYKRTQERYKKYRTQYGDLARHYKLLERENAKARSVLVETQDKALRRISELKEQCSLEQSAKAHLEKALRVELDEKNMKIQTLNTKIQFLQENTQSDATEHGNETTKPVNETKVQLINLDSENTSNEESTQSEITNLNNKIEKMEQLLNKYKESLKVNKEKNSQLSIEIKKLTNDLENKNKEIQDLKNMEEQLQNANKIIQELNDDNEELQNKVNAYDFNKTKEMSALEIDLQKANEEIKELSSKIEIFSKREEEYAISLAENKLSIHKELESKEAEIKSLKDSLLTSKNEIQSLHIVNTEYKNKITALEEEKSKLNNDYAELITIRSKLNEMELQYQELVKKCQSLEQLKTKTDEEYKCLQLQLKQETAEKMAMIDRNSYLESRNTQLTEENVKKSSQITKLENELKEHLNNKESKTIIEQEKSEKFHVIQELTVWKEKCSKLESEIQEERIELVKLQAEIEKLLAYHELLQNQNAEYRVTIADLTTRHARANDDAQKYKLAIKNLSNEIKQLRDLLSLTSIETHSLINNSRESLCSVAKDINNLLIKSVQKLQNKFDSTTAQYTTLSGRYKELENVLEASNNNYLGLIKDLDKLREENNNLKEKLYKQETTQQLIDKKLNNTITEYEESLNQTSIIKNKNEALSRQIEELEKTVKHNEETYKNEKLQHDTVYEQLKTLQLEHENAESTKQLLQQQNSKLKEELESLQSKQKEYIDRMNILTQDNEDLIMKNKSLDLQVSQQLQTTVGNEEALYLAATEQIKLLESEKQNITEKNFNLEADNQSLVKKSDQINEDYQTALNKIKELDLEIINQTKEIEEYRQIQASLELQVAEHLMKNEEFSNIEIEKQNLMCEIQKLEQTKKQYHSQFEELNERYTVANDTITKLNSEINNKTKEIENKLIFLSELEKNNQILSEENISLKSEAANFVSNIKTLELEIDNIKKSHAEIEVEKDHLNKIIDSLEKNQSENLKTSDSKDTQTEEQVNNGALEPTALLENKWVLENKHSTMSHTASLNLTNSAQEDLVSSYSLLKNNYENLKDENRRLQSDIEGLQTYMTKISKENSILNDKLREVIASSEHSIDNDQLSSDVKELRNEIQLNKDKINDLVRENALLIEENLDLKDQVQSQNYSKISDIPRQQNSSDEKKNYDKMKGEVDDLLTSNIQLEKRNIDLEQINKSVNNNNKQLQDKNDRLKLSNEKLERRLDEALVSLRHLHSLQENTELEYLRNILYEYLTGSGTHSVTLAKVLSAIVKFDDSQTQLVLQKEKERQGFLRQLGLL